jgi:hypothetical protein
MQKKADTESLREACRLYLRALNELGYGFTSVDEAAKALRVSPTKIRGYEIFEEDSSNLVAVSEKSIKSFVKIVSGTNVIQFSRFPRGKKG